jgi:hypothetical protein
MNIAEYRKALHYKNTFDSLGFIIEWGPRDNVHLMPNQAKWEGFSESAGWWFDTVEEAVAHAEGVYFATVAMHNGVKWKGDNS